MNVLFLGRPPPSIVEPTAVVFEIEISGFQRDLLLLESAYLDGGVYRFDYRGFTWEIDAEPYRPREIKRHRLFGIRW